MQKLVIAIYTDDEIAAKDALAAATTAIQDRALLVYRAWVEPATFDEGAQESSQ